MATTITNSSVDIAAALVTATPLTRVTDVDTLRVKESDVPLQFDVTATSTQVWMTYDELVNLDVAAKKVAEAEGVLANCQALEAALTAIVDSFSDYDEAEYKAAVEDLRALNFVRGFE